VLFNNLATIPATTFQCPPTRTARRNWRLKSTKPCASGHRRAGRATISGRSRCSTRFTDYGSGPHGDAGHFRDHQEPARLLMTETIQLGEISIAVTRKNIKNVHLSV
jgi:hypothetical protein